MSWENCLLDWFASLKIPMSEKRAHVGGLQYYLFSSSFQGAGGRNFHAFGSSPDRKLAAIKCAGEAAERKFMGEFFHRADSETEAFRIQLKPDAIETAELVSVPLPPRGLRTSNGWAVHSSQEDAVRVACLEALERHLLIKSFYRWRWAGFRLVHETSNDDLRVFFMASRLMSAGYVAGIVAAKSPMYPGVSFGYSAGREEETANAGFWESALFESVSKFDSLAGRPVEVPDDANAWLWRATKEYLENPMDLSLLNVGRNHAQEQETARSCFLKVFDLREVWDLKFPLYAAFCWGGDLIPLCDVSIMDDTGRGYFNDIIARNSIDNDVPPRHPII